jgi:hypothetical protein
MAAAKCPSRRVLKKIRGSARDSFNLVADELKDGVLGGFIRSDGTIFFVPFSQDVRGHLDVVGIDPDPAHWLAGFSVGVKRGRAAWFIFRSAINHPGIHPHELVQSAIIESLPKGANWKVFL